VRLVALLCAALSLLAVAPAGAASSPVGPCKDRTGFANTTLTLVMTVKPVANMSWKFPEAPSVVSTRILTGLNTNDRGIVFKEANGVIPNLYFTVTMSETNEGTQQDQAWVEVTGLALPGVLFRESSGSAPYIGWRDAIDHLVTNVLVWFQNGWHTTSPCRLPDGTIRKSYP
jgi:hypothetical protein